MPSLDDTQLVGLIRQIVQQSIAEANDRARIPAILTGTVEGVDEDSGNVAWVRLDGQAMASDPTQSDNWDNPGVLPMTQLGQSTLDEQVRVTFDGAAGGSAMRTGVAGVDLNLDVDSTQGIIKFLADETVVGHMDATRWELGTPGEALARIDPIGGLRLRDGNDVLRVQLGSTEGLILRDAETGGTGAILNHDGLIVPDPETGDTISVTSGTTSAVPTPRWASGVSAVDPAGTTHGTPAVSSFDTGDDIDIRFVAASDNSDLGAPVWTAPASYTEHTDFSSTGPITLATSSATRDPAIASPGAANFTTTGVSNWSRRNGHSVIVRGGGGTSPAFRSASSGTVVESSAATVGLTITAPAGVVEGDMMIAFVAIAGPGIPVGWTVPAGWKQLGVNVAGLGTPHILASGIWYKVAGASEPASESVTINMAAAGVTKFHATVVAVSGPYAFPGGLDIRRNNRSMPRGLEASVVAITDTATFSVSGNTSLDTITDYPAGVPMIAGRTYVFQLLMPAVEIVAGGATEWRIALRKDNTTDISNFAIIQIPSGTYRLPVNAAFYYVPTANESARWTIRFNEVAGTGTLTGLGSAGSPRRLDIIDMGATF